MLRNVKTSTLLAVCGGAGIALAGMAMLLNKESTRFASQAGFVKTALDLVEKEPEVLNMIGQPYALGQPKVLDLWLGADTNNVKVRVPVKGANDTAFIYAFARKKDPKAKLKLFKIEMTFDKIKGKKMILFDVEDKGTGHDILVAQPQPEKSEPQKLETPIPEGLIPERDPSKPRRIPAAVLRHRKSAATSDGASNGADATSPTAGDDNKSSDQKSSLPTSRKSHDDDNLVSL